MLKHIQKTIKNGIMSTSLIFLTAQVFSPTHHLSFLNGCTTEIEIPEGGNVGELILQLSIRSNKYLPVFILSPDNNRTTPLPLGTPLAANGGCYTVVENPRRCPWREEMRRRNDSVVLWNCCGVLETEIKKQLASDTGYDLLLQNEYNHLQTQLQIEPNVVHYETMIAAQKADHYSGPESFEYLESLKNQLALNLKS
jgi:hypothetical protein